MVPVRLQLRNFLSYGEAAPPLDFEGIHVACLSGGNGQGKSALLDAMTWALWGEARKSSENRKPDEELLRIGALEMEVDFTFRIGGGEHRVVRSFRLSASGKSKKPGLEFQVRDGDDWRAITTNTVKETQEAIDAQLGIDYETFINSTFLLQGRSDEFTKKKPGERKEILGKILGLDRYERMAARANVRWSAVRQRVQALETEAERLTAALEHEETWTAELAEVEARVQTLDAQRAEAATASEAAAARLAALDAVAREVDALRAAVADLGARLAARDADRDRLRTQAETADTLIARAEAIEADHARYEALRKRRTDLDEKAGLFRALEAQRHGLRLDLQKATAEAEAAVTRAEAALATLRERRADDERRLEGRAAVEASLAAATAASEALRALDQVRTRRLEATARIESIDKRLAADRGALEGKRAAVIEEGTRLKEGLAPAADHDEAALAAVQDRGAAAAVALDSVQSEGADQSAAVKALDAQLARLAAERTALAERRDRVLSAQEETCPTCGTPLTEGHREEVAASYAAELAALATRAAALQAERDEATRQRDALRVDYQRLKAEVDAAAAAAATLTSLRERAEQRRKDEERIGTLREEARRLQRVLDDEAFGQELRASRAAAADVLDANPLDEAEFDRVRRDAGLRDHWTATLRDLDRAAERHAATVADIQRKEGELSALRDAAASGAAGAGIREKLEALGAQVEAVGYDPAEHEAVGRDLDALAEAPKQLAQLLDARRSRADLAERLAAIAEERVALVRDREAREATLRDRSARLDDRAAAQTARAEAEAARTAAAAALAEAQARRGGLRERLERAARDRQSLTETRKALRAAKDERVLYHHLRRAFGRNGIPSLIIEETLPEIEARANQLLDRLAKGRTRVALETLKDKKSGGGTRETLDIRITDSQGIARSYETYSGGEAFRVNFALRIALSQMLAERSGTQIRTLVIDEGFGTQDTEGLQSLIGAIRAIQDDFDTILVITHLDEIKAAFPVRIEVRKEPVTGSTFEIVGV